MSAGDKSTIEQDDEELLCSLVESKAMGPAIKAVLDRGWQGSYEEYLDNNIDKKKDQIRGICNDSYQEFIGAIDNLVTVKLDIQDLKQEIKALNDDVQKSGTDLVDKASELTHYRVVRKNIDNAIHVLSNCEYLMSLAAKAQSQIESQKYFSALKTLDQLQRLHLPRFAEYEFAQQLEQQIPHMISEVKETAKSDFNAWLLTIRDISKRVGSQVMKRLTAESDGILADPGEEAAPQKVNYAPVFQCLHIFESLNVANEFQKFYHERRKAQALQAMEIRSLAPNEFLKHQEDYFAQVAGFFIIEDTIMKSGNGDGLMTRVELENLWELATSKLQTILRDQFAKQKEVASFLEVKQKVLVFCRAVATAGLSEQPLLDFIMQERSKFEQILTTFLDARLLDIIAKERFEPLHVRDESTYEAKVLAYELQDASINMEYPATMPFSVSVPEICSALQTFVEQHTLFAVGLTDQATAVRAALDRVLVHRVNVELNNVISKTKDLHISQVVQFSINAAYLAEEACNWIIKHALILAKANWLEAPPLAASKAFQQTRMKCEDLVFEMISGKMDHFLVLLTTGTWLPKDAQRGPSDCVTDLVAYLESTLMMMMFLPDAVREAIHFTTCKHVSTSILEALKSSAVKKFNLIAMYNLNFDLKELEDFALRCSVENLAEVFKELRQLIDFFLSGNLSSVLEPAIKQAKYSHLSYESLCVVMEKYKDVGMMMKMPPGLDKLKRKEVEAVLKQVKTRL